MATQLEKYLLDRLFDTEKMVREKEKRIAMLEETAAFISNEIIDIRNEIDKDTKSIIDLIQKLEEVNAELLSENIELKKKLDLKMSSNT
jgi:uncharacterized coiled-coil protein SlyX